MKLGRVFAVVLLVMFAAATAAMAKADTAPGDPVVTIGTTSKPCSGPLCDPTFGDADDNPLVITDDSGETDIIYSGPTAAAYYVEIIPFAGESLTTFENEIFTCTPGAGANECNPAPVCTQNEPQADGAECPVNGPAQEFVFTDNVGGVNLPFIQTGEELAIYTPEPSAGELLLIGFAALVCFGFRRRQTNPV